MGYSNEETLDTILKSTYTEQHVELFQPTFPGEQINKWMSKKLTTAAKVNFEKVLRAGRVDKSKPELQRKDVVQLCTALGWSRQELMETPAAKKLYQKVWDMYW